MTYPGYPEYKDSGVEWLGEVPAHWMVSRLKFFGDLITGITPPSEDLTNYTEAGWPWIRPDDLDDQGKPVKASKFLTEQGWAYCRPVGAGSTLVCCIGSIGKLGYTQELACTNQQVTAIQAFVEARYLFYLVYASKQELDQRATGNVLRILNAERLGNVPAVMPPTYESAQIATFLDYETARIDTLVEEQKRLIALLKEKRQAVISYAVTKGLDPEVPMIDSGVEWLREVPEHWGVRGLTKLIGPVVDYRGRTPTKVDDGVFLVTARNIRNGRIDYEISKEYVTPESVKSLLQRGKPEIGDLLFTMEAPLGQVALIDRTDIALAQRIVKFRAVKGLMINTYLMYWLMSTGCQSRMETLATGSTALGIKASKLGMIECPVPPVTEQIEIVNLIERESSKHDILLAEAQTNIDLLRERRSALISAAVTGKIDVRGWQPPASSAGATVEATQMEAV